MRHVLVAAGRSALVLVACFAGCSKVSRSERADHLDNPSGNKATSAPTAPSAGSPTGATPSAAEVRALIESATVALPDSEEKECTGPLGATFKTWFEIMSSPTAAAVLTVECKAQGAGWHCIAFVGTPPDPACEEECDGSSMALELDLDDKRQIVPSSLRCSSAG